MNNKTFGERLLTLCSMFGVSQKDLAIELGLSDSAISKYVKNEAFPLYTNLLNIAEKYDVSIDWLVGRSNISKVLNPDCELMMLGDRTKEIISLLFSLSPEELESFYKFLSIFIKDQNIIMDNYEDVKLFVVCTPKEEE